MLIVVALAFPTSTGCKSFTNSSNTSLALLTEEGTDLQLGLAQRAERSGDLVQARAAYRAILEKQPDCTSALHRLGVVSVRLEQLPEALDCLEKAAGHEAPSSELLGDLGYAQLLSGDLEAAQETLDKALALDPTDKRIINNQGLVLGYLGQEEDSLELFRRAGSEAEALGNMGFVYAQMGELQKAKEFYLRAVHLQPDLKNAAQALVDLHDAEQRARQTLSVARELPRQPPETRRDSDSGNP